MATSPAQLRTPSAPLPVLVPAEPLRVGHFELVRPWRMQSMLLAADILALTIAAVFAPAARTLYLLPLACAAAGLYSPIPRHSAEELRRIVAATVLAFVFTDVSAAGALGCTAVVLLLATVRRIARAAFASRTWWGMSVAVLAADRRHADEVAELLRRKPHLGLKAVALLHAGGTDGDPGANLPVRGSLDFAAALPRDYNINSAVVAAGTAAEKH